MTDGRRSSRQAERLLSQIQDGLGDSLRDCIIVAAFDFEGVLLNVGARPLPFDLGRLDEGIRAFTETLPVRARQEGLVGVLIGYGTDEQVRPSIMDMTGALMRHPSWTVFDMLRVVGDRFWSYTCEDPACCPPEGRRFGASNRAPASEE